MPKRSKSNNKHKYAKILKKRCKNWRFGIHVQSLVCDDLQCNLGNEEAWF